jgi:hypothetical protein
MFCKNCGTALIPEKQIKSPIRQTKILGIDNRLVALVLGALLLVSIILGVITINTHNRLSITQIKLSNTQTQLVATQNQLSTTKNQLATTQNQLVATQSQLTTAQNEITQLTDTDNGPVIPAKTVLDQFLSDATASDYQAMWAMLSPDCRALYSSESDFESNNVVAQKNGYYLLSSYYIGSASILPSWQNYSNVPEIQVVLVANESPTANIVSAILSDIIPGLGLIDGMVPTTTVTPWDAHCMQIGNEWEIYCERSATAAPTNSSATTTTTLTATTTTPSSGGMQLSDLIPTDTSSSQAWADKASIWNNKTIQITGQSSSINISGAQAQMNLYQDFNYISVNFTSALFGQLNQIKSGSTVTITGMVVYQGNQVTINGTGITQ